MSSVSVERHDYATDSPTTVGMARWTMSDPHLDGGKPVSLDQQPRLGDRFEPISEAHKHEKQRVEEAIEAYARGDDPAPLSVRGPFRTGKTALQFHAFEYAWDQGLPAVYIEASTLLAEYDATESPGLFEQWVFDRVRDEVADMADRDVDEKSWLPSARTSRGEWLEEHVSTDVDAEQALLLVDEVEQEYESFLSVTGVDDDNPLRKLLDKPELFPVLSMGQLSAFEFVGDADLGRMEPISIPPVTVDHVEALLADQDADTALGRVTFWLTRGRAARVHQLVSQASKRDLSPSDHQAIANWLAEYVQERSTEFRPIRQVWEDTDISDPEAAAGALAFDSDGYEDWVVKSDNRYAVDDVVAVFETILVDSLDDDGFDAEAARDARRLLRQCTRWVVRSVAVPDDDGRSLPANWLAAGDESVAVLNLIQDFLLAFEAKLPARDLAFETLESAKDSFHSRYTNELATEAAEHGAVSTVRPTALERAFPPLATNPDRLVDGTTEALEARMDRGLEVSTAAEATVYACPTQDAFEGQLRALAPDPTHPVAVLVDEDVAVDAGLDEAPVAEQLEAHNVLTVTTVPTKRVWEFVVNLYGRLEAETDAPYRATEDVIAEQAATAEQREVRTTLEKLYDHLSSRVAGEVATEAVQKHVDRFDETPVWAAKAVAGDSWVNPQAAFGEGRHAVATLLLLGATPGQPEVEEFFAIETSLESDAIDTKSGFNYKELLSHVQDSGDYGKAIRTPRRRTRSDDDSGVAAPVERLEGTFQAVLEASEHETDELGEALYNDQTPGNSSDNSIEKVLDTLAPTDTNETTRDVLWAVLTGGLARRDADYVVPFLDDVADDVDELVERLDDYLADVADAEAILGPADGDATESAGMLDQIEAEIDQQVGSHSDDTAATTPSVPGPSLSLDASHLDTYRENLVTVRDALRAASERAEDEADFRPTGYALAVLGARYEHVVRDAVDELDRGTPAATDLGGVRQLRDTTEELRTAVDDETLSDSDATEVVDSFVATALDLNEVIQGSKVPVGNPDGNGMRTIRTLNDAALVRAGQASELKRDLESLAEARERAGRILNSTRESIKGLVNVLETPDQIVEENWSLSGVSVDAYELETPHQGMATTDTEADQ